MNPAETGHPPPLSVLVPLDGSPHATIALDAAKRLQPGRIVLLRVEAEIDLLIPELPPVSDEEHIRELHESLQAEAAPLQALGFTVDVVVRSGDPSSVIVEEAKAVDLIVMTTRGRGAAGRIIFGSVADRVTRSTETPVMLVRARSGHVVEPTRIVVPLDGSADSERGLPMATRLAEVLDCPIALVRSIDLDDIRATIRTQRKAGKADGTWDEAHDATREIARIQLEAHRSQLAASGYDSDIVMLDGTPSFVLLEAIVETDLVVMSSHGIGGYWRWLLGSVAEKLVREAKAPVVVVPTRAQSGSTERETTTMSGNQPGSGEGRMLELLHKDHYTPQEIAYVLGIDVDTILQAAHRHELPAVFIGHDVATIARSDLLHWLENRR